MTGISLKTILASLPESTTVTLPERWFEKLADDVSVFESLYRWMAAERSVDPDRLHSRTYVGASLAKKLLAAERKRLQRRHKLSGDKLERAVTLSDGNAGPLTLFAERVVQGDVLLVVRAEDDDRVQALEHRLLDEAREAKNRDIRDLASGASFYEWLLSNIGRDDPVGDLAGDAQRDHGFPKAARRLEEARSGTFMRQASTLVREAMLEAWIEYAERYPSRLPKTAWCDVCDNEIATAVTGLVAWLAAEEKFVVGHITCVRLNAGDPSLPLTGVSRDTLDDFANLHDVPAELAAETEGKLRACGLLAAKASTVVYFVQSGDAGAGHVPVPVEI